MPSKNSLKLYVENGYYHLYNRGVEKRLIFLDNQDRTVFLSYLKQYLLSKDEERLTQMFLKPNSSYKEKADALKLLRLNNFANEIILLSYCLMPNHFHFLIKQKSSGSIDKFMNSLCTRYTMYFNKKHKRVGPLYQGVYKAVLVETDEQLLHLSRYIHKQALGTKGDALRGSPNFYFEQQPCSYPEYLNQRKTRWVHPKEVLSYFSVNNPKLSYENFVREDDDFTCIGKLILEDENKIIPS